MEDGHFTCFQFHYDWRRDISENAAELDRFIAEKRNYIREQYARRYGIQDCEVRFDIVAHSLGGLLARYYLRYGARPLPRDRSVPAVSWAGAKNVRQVVLVGTPNAGSTFAFRELVEGHQLSRFLPFYPPAVVGTLPSVYQMLPRPRHRVVTYADRSDLAVDLYDPELWQRMRWGLANPEHNEVLEELLPDVASRDIRRHIALRHQAKCRSRARQFPRALDALARPPRNVKLHLFAGDSIETPAALSVAGQSGEVRIAGYGPGDGTSTRASTVFSEQPVGGGEAGRTSSIDW